MTLWLPESGAHAPSAQRMSMLGTSLALGHVGGQGRHPGFAQPARATLKACKAGHAAGTWPAVRAHVVPLGVGQDRATRRVPASPLPHGREAGARTPRSPRTSSAAVGPPPPPPPRLPAAYLAKQCSQWLPRSATVST